MKTRLSLSLPLACLAALLLNGCGKSDNSASGTADPGPAKPGEFTIAVIPKGTTHSYWKSVQAGAQKAADELKVKMEWKGPLKEDDRAQQIGIVEQYASSGISAILLAPLDDNALRRPVTSAMEKKIPVVVIDSALNGTVGKDFTSYVATDNKAGGMMAGKRMVELLGGKGKVAMLRYAEGSASTVAREAGFLEVVKAQPGIEVTVENRYGGVTASEAQSNAVNMLDKLKEADGIYTPNESTTFGMLLALRQNAVTGKKFVGFDTSGPLLDAMGKGEIQGLVAQNPKKMGYEAMKVAVAALKGEKYEQNIDSGAKLITPENLQSPEVQELVTVK